MGNVYVVVIDQTLKRNPERMAPNSKETSRHFYEEPIVFVFGNSFCLLCVVINRYVIEDV